MTLTRTMPALPTSPVALERALWALVAVATVGDLATTQIGLGVGLVESNPAARGAIDGYGLAGMVGLKAGVIGVGVACRPLLGQPYRPIIPLGLALPWLGATVLNLALLARIGVAA